MNRKQRKLMHLFLNAITLTVFTWLQMIIFIIMRDVLDGGELMTMFVVSLICVPLLTWGLFDSDR